MLKLQSSAPGEWKDLKSIAGWNGMNRKKTRQERKRRKDKESESDMSVTDKFLKYVSFDTQSDASSKTAPSTMKQLKLARQLKDELLDLGVEDAHVDEFGIVYASLPANREQENDRTIGLIAHMDTATELSGKNVHPQIIKNYDGSRIILNEKYSMSPEQVPGLNNVIGDDLIVTDGTTLLGADDKAGVAIIMQSIENMIKDNRPHGRVLIAFTPDEEIGRGVDHFNLTSFPADFAYTVDGGDIQSVDYETFNAAMAKIEFSGRVVHPGDAKNKMVNACAAAVKFAAILPQWMRPEHTEGYEGYLHLMKMNGDGDHASLFYLIRDHDRALFEHKKEILKDTARIVNDLYPDCCKLEIEDQYYNMKDYMNGSMEAVERAKKALQAHGIEPKSTAIRGGTDGACLTEKGLVTPNLGTGGDNYHGRYEYVSINKMNKMVDVVCTLLEG